jgi:hypothetical protein
MLTTEQIRAKAASGPPIHPYQVKAWGGEAVALQELDGLQIHEWDSANLERSKDERVLLSRGTGAEHMVRLCLVTCDLDAEGNPVRGTGKRVFNDTRGDVLELRRFGGALQELYLECLKINRPRRVDEENAEKNSEPAPSSDSGATLPTDGAAP